MTSTERKILKCLWDAKGRAHVNVVSRNVGIGTDYTRLICRSLARAGYLKFADASVCYLLTRGRNHFQRNDEPVAEERSDASQIILVSSTLIPPVDGHDSDDKENIEQPSEEQAISTSSEPEEKARATAILEETSQEVLASTPSLPEKTAEVEEEMKKALEEAGKETQTVVENSQPEEKKEPALDQPKEATAQEKEKPTEGLVEAVVSKFIDGIGIGIQKAASWMNEARRQTGVTDEGGHRGKE